MRRNEKIRECLHSSLDKVLDELIAKGLFEKSNTLFFSMQQARDIVDGVQTPLPVMFIPVQGPMFLVKPAAMPVEKQVERELDDDDRRGVMKGTISEPAFGPNDDDNWPGEEL